MMEGSGATRRRPIVYRKCVFGHVMRVYPEDARIDIELCPLCLKRKIHLRRRLGDPVPAELLMVAVLAERGK